MKFQAGQKVFHKSKNKIGTVVKGFSTEAGIRYYINHSGFTWSVSETALLAA